MTTSTLSPDTAGVSGYEPVIGIEVHVELATATKMFCRCRNAPFELQPNRATCPTCLGLPGGLPVVNRRAVLLGIRAALALNCQIADVCMFERKNYPYPDLVKGYQLSQYELPVGRNGYVPVDLGDGTERRVPIRRAHLEEDTAKLLHREGDYENISLLDCNRSGVPLLEIVTEPAIHSAEEAEAYLRQLRTLLVHNGISRCRMQRGEMRLEANVSVRPVGSTEFGTRVEIKNQSSFRFVRDAIHYEVARQSELLRNGGTVRQATCGWDPNLKRTFEQRSKEEAHDYRYFHDPDLPPVRIESEWVEQQQRELPEPLDVFRKRLADLGVSSADIKAVVAAGAVPFLHEAYEAWPQGADQLAKWLPRAVFPLMNEDKIEIEDSKLTPGEFAAAVRLKAGNKVNDEGTRTIIAELFREGGSAGAIAEAKSLSQIADPDAVARMIDEVFAARPDLVDDYRAGKVKVKNALFGMVMRKMNGRGNPKEVEAALVSRLGG